MYHFFVEPSQIQGNKIIITGKDVNHIKNVLRMKPGEEIAVSNGLDGKEYHCGIAEWYEDRIVCDLFFVKEEGVELASKIYLFQGLPKADKMELIIQKAVELGVYEIIPVASKRAVVKLDAKKAESKLIRWQAIAEAAAKQSARGIIPQVKMPMSFSEALKYAAQLEYNMIPYENAQGMKTAGKIMETAMLSQSVGIFIGPEGGYEEKEIEAAIAAGVNVVSLGKRILRTETAGMTVLSILMFGIESNR